MYEVYHVLEHNHNMEETKIHQLFFTISVNVYFNFTPCNDSFLDTGLD